MSPTLRWVWNGYKCVCCNHVKQYIYIHFKCYHLIDLKFQIANIGPADYNYDESISTLRYANRAKNIQNKAKINEDPKDALLRQFQKEIEELRKQLEEGTCWGNHSKNKLVLYFNHILINEQLITFCTLKW